jgi:hypothetical protein
VQGKPHEAMAWQNRLPAWDGYSMLGRRMRTVPWPRLSNRAAVASLALVLLAGCIPIGGVHFEDADGTVNFNHSSQDVTPCAKDELSATFAGAKVSTLQGMTEITVVGNYGGSTAMLVDIQDDGPGKSKAIVHAHDYMLVWGPAVDRALKSLKKCQNLRPDLKPS